MGRDRISNLPENVIDHILSFLPFRDTVRTSVLSTKWRYKWSDLPYLVVDCVDNPLPKTIIDRTLSLHRGQILKFKLLTNKKRMDQAICRWIMHLSRGPIKELEITNEYFNRSKVPRCLFSCQSLTHLSLGHFTIAELPSNFKGFPNLRSLELTSPEMAKDVLENLISSCTMLNSLVLLDVEDFSNLTIRAPNLKYFRFMGICKTSLEGISFVNTSCLTHVKVTFYGDGNFRAPSNLRNFCAQLPMIRNLDINFHFVKYLVVGVVPGETRISCPSLDSLCVDFSLNNGEDCLNAVCILSAFPNLRELKIQANSLVFNRNNVGENETKFLEDLNFQIRFTKLQLVEISKWGISGTRRELDFVKFMLSKSPVLEQMAIRLQFIANKVQVLEKLLRLRRASDRALVTCFSKLYDL